jgi:asparagine synthase (glutamine-hydrolysing)
MKLIPGTIGLIPPYLLNKAFKYSSALGSGGLERLSRFCRNIQDIGSSYIDVACVFNQSEKQRLYGSALREQLENEDIAETINGEFFSSKATNSQDLFNQLSYFELKTRLPNDLLAKVDSMTMAHSIEGRVPYLDHRFVEFASGISYKLKLRRLKEKYILRKASTRFIPPSIAGRRKDHFFVPIHLWLQNELKPIAEKVLTKENLEKTGLLNPDFILYAYHNYRKGALYYARQIWNVLFFLIWHKMFIETELYRSMQKQHLPLEDLIQSA